MEINFYAQEGGWNCGNNISSSSGCYYFCYCCGMNRGSTSNCGSTTNATNTIILTCCAQRSLD